MDKIKCALIFFLVSSLALSQEHSEHNYIPPDGYVPSAEVAIRIAEAILEPVYGIESIKDEKPFTAKLQEDETWEVRGTLPKGFKGGVAEVHISRKDGHIIRMTHGR